MSSSPAVELTHSTRPDDPVILITHTDAGEGGVDGEWRTVIYGDGTMVRPVAGYPEGYTTWTTAQLTPQALEALLTTAQEANLFTERETGDPLISDSPWSTLSLILDSGTFGHRIYAPKEKSNLSEAELAARADISTLMEAVSRLGRDDFVRPEQPYQVERLALTATSGAMKDLLALEGEPTPLTYPWPGPTPLPELFASSACAEISGPDLTAVAQLQAELGEDNRVVPIATGESLPSALRLRVEPLLPHDMLHCTVDPPAQEGLAEPWPATDRAPATPWQRWRADEAVVLLAEADKLGAEANGTSDLSWYDLRYSTGTADGVQIIDVAADDRSESGYGKRSPQTFAVRLDATTGEVLDLESQR